MPAIHSITIPATRSYKLLELAGGSFAGDFSVVESLSSLVCMATRRVTQFVINFNNNNKTVSTMEVNTRQKVDIYLQTT